MRGVACLSTLLAIAHTIAGCSGREDGEPVGPRDAGRGRDSAVVRDAGDAGGITDAGERDGSAVPLDAPAPLDAARPTDARPGIDAPPECVVGATRACWEGDPDLEGVGACVRGSETCVDMGSEFGPDWGPCLGSGSPSAEACGNGIDDDCDGATDEGCGGDCPPAMVVWELPAGTTGGPECIRTGGGTCAGTTDPCMEGESCWTRDPTCRPPDAHAATLRCNDGSYVNDCYCDVIATCSGGTVVATGFTW